jgi:hypothetical protein
MSRCLVLHTTRSNTRFYILPTQFIAVICMDLRTKSNHFATQLNDSHVLIRGVNGSSTEYSVLLEQFERNSVEKVPTKLYDVIVRRLKMVQ